MRVIAVPDGHVRTKPRALNFGLDFTRGSIIGIYDAEDAPAPDQLLKVAAAFAHGPARLGCVQGMLDFYNPRTNWIARCFTLEYAAWFRLFLPGLVRLGLPVPLGGTTLFLRRDAVTAGGRLGCPQRHRRCRSWPPPRPARLADRDAALGHDGRGELPPPAHGSSSAHAGQRAI